MCLHHHLSRQYVFDLGSGERFVLQQGLGELLQVSSVGVQAVPCTLVRLVQQVLHLIVPSTYRQTRSSVPFLPFMIFRKIHRETLACRTLSSVPAVKPIMVMQVFPTTSESISVPSSCLASSFFLQSIFPQRVRATLLKKKKAQKRGILLLLRRGWRWGGKKGPYFAPAPGR